MMEPGNKAKENPSNARVIFGLVLPFITIQDRQQVYNIWLFSFNLKGSPSNTFTQEELAESRHNEELSACIELAICVQDSRESGGFAPQHT